MRFTLNFIIVIIVIRLGLFLGLIFCVFRDCVFVGVAVLVDFSFFVFLLFLLFFRCRGGRRRRRGGRCALLAQPIALVTLARHCQR